MNDLRIQQLQQQQQQQTQRNSNFSTATIVKKRNTGGSFSLSRQSTDINVDRDYLNVNKNEFIDQNSEQENHYTESQYPEDMLDVQVIAKMQEESK